MFQKEGGGAEDARDSGRGTPTGEGGGVEVGRGAQNGEGGGEEDGRGTQNGEGGGEDGRGSQSEEGGGGEGGRGSQTEGVPLERQVLDELCNDLEMFTLISERHPDVLHRVMQMKEWKK